MKSFVSSVAFTLFGALCAFSEPVTLWQTGDAAQSGNGDVTSQYGVGLVLAPEVFTNVTAGARLSIEVEVDGWAELYLKNGDEVQIYPSTRIDNGVASEILTDFQLNEINNNNGFCITASNVMKIKKITADNSAYSGDFKNAIWIGNQTFTADWGGLVKFCPAQAAQVKAGDVLKVYYAKDAESTSVMVNYINGEGKQTDYYPQWKYDNQGASFVVAEDFVNLLAEYGKGFVVKGASITVSRVDLIHPATPEDGVLWQGNQTIDWTTGNAVVVPSYFFADAMEGDVVKFEYATVPDAGYYNLKPFVPGSDGQIALCGNLDITPGSTSYEYTLTADNINNLKAYGMEIQGWGLEMKKVSIVKKGTTGVDAVEVENSNEPVEYYDIQGVKVSEPTCGLYIKRQGNTVSKIFVK